MADNVVANAGSGGATFATDEIGGIHFPRFKLIFGVDGSNAGDVATSNPLPIELRTPAGDSAMDDSLDAIKAVLSANSGVDIGDVDILSLPGVASEGATLGSGMLIQGDDGTDRKNIHVDATTGDVQVDVTNTVTISDGGGAISIDDGGNVITVDGTVTANLGATDNAVLDQIDNNTDFGAQTGGGTEANALRVTIANDSTGVISVDDNGSSLSIDDGGNIITVDGTVSVGNTVTVAGTVTANLGATDNGVLDAIQTAVELIDNAIAGSEMQVDVVAALPAGSNNIGDVDIASIVAGSNLIGDVGISGARTSGGTTIFRSIDIDETEEAVKASAGQVYWINCINLTASVVYLKFYNATTGSVTVGTTTPVLTFPVPTQGDTNAAGFVLAIPNGITFGTAITVACTTGAG